MPPNSLALGPHCLVRSRKAICVSRRPVANSLAGDALYLMTDALAEWFLRQFAAGGRPWKDIDGLSEASFADWVQAQRKNRRLKNDDVTLVKIQMGVTQP